MKQQILSWWFGLQVREQRIVSLAGVVIAIALFYWLLWQPLHQAKIQRQQTVTAAQLQLQRLQQAIPSLLAAGSASVRTGGSLAQIISNSARTQSITVSRMQPQNEQLALVLDDLSFERLLPWLYELQYQHGVHLVSLDLAQADKPGIVRVRRIVVE
ncbi:type II secretion system protein GspM [Rheinheimera salexigens]|uniref:Type II secretion system protein M n=1 Tax=Rheinheimera salexigens TaxID=1628148 RepID=A0A1E7Q1Y8_9GAMM|nr:type II secretion system protein M [Rheinheimera salexigens]OEY68192.1 type II secretory pathway protein [Rheinheimera salexigens]